jgi:hypothetical protein
MKPYSEVSRFDLIATTGSFYDVGSPISIGETPGTFSDPLHNKAQIRLSFPVKNPVKMLPNSSSIYYYNKTAKQWNIPTISIRDHVGPFDKFAFPTWPSVKNGVSPTGANGTITTEDCKGFDAYGRCVVSGSLTILRTTRNNTDLSGELSNQTIAKLGSTAEGSRNTVPLLTEDYPASPQRSSIYDASKDETFSIDIDAPFLLEKAVFEIPFAMGPTWFQDRTTTCLAKASGSYLGSEYKFTAPDLPLNIASQTPQATGSSPYIDRGGPAITLSLFCQKNFGTSSIRDLILTGTITHELDSKKTFIPRPDYWADPSYGAWLAYIEPFGISTPAAVVNYSLSGTVPQFTGSVVVKTEACVSNGYVLTWVVNEQLSNSQGTSATPLTTSSYYQAYSDKFSNQRVSETSVLQRNNSTRTTLLSSLDAFGRGMSGFAPSGGSIFGGEYTTNATDVGYVSNPYYVPDESLRASALGALTSSVNAMLPHASDPSGLQAAFTFILDVDSFSSTRNSPYLIRPGDKLILALSKTRPAVSASGHNITDLTIGAHYLTKQVPRTGSIDGHDVTLTTGSINVTFYGSYVKEGKNYIP